MRTSQWTKAAVVAGMALVTTTAMAQPRTDFGKLEYDNNCAVCHGSSGKGDGIYVEILKRSPPDLTTMTKRNGGVFPVNKVYEVIEGAGYGHGTREMPIWGKEFSVGGADYYRDLPFDREAFVRGRILSVIEYLNRLQVK
jgi:mono/diheme cytochrome c family protein